MEYLYLYFLLIINSNKSFFAEKHLNTKNIKIYIIY